MADLILGSTTAITESGGTVTFPTASSTIKYPTGMPIQIVNQLVTAQANVATSASGDVVVSGMTMDITPKGTASKFLVTVRWSGEVNNAWDIVFNIQMDGIRCNEATGDYHTGLTSPWSGYGAGDTSTTPENTFFSTMVSSSSVIGTDITFRLVASGTAQTLYTNSVKDLDAAQEEFTSELIITEIAG